MNIFISVLLLLGIVFSVNTRRKMMMWRSEPPSNPLAKAITQLVGTAGGIYLSLELLLTFIGLPEEIWNPPSIYYFKPLAVFSLFIAIIQPYGQKLMAYIQKRRVC
ncbi:MAG: hypothetical protein GX091_00750 [Peptococcaceae bacterium]|nr:hypothetical protein [Peptococcaceae bacterium]